MRAIRKFTFEERKLIEKYLKEGISLNNIAMLLLRAKSSVSVEINRCPMGEYTAQRATETTRIYLDRNKVRTEGYSKIDRVNQKIKEMRVEIDMLFEIIKDLQNGKN